MEARADKNAQFPKENFPFGLKQNQMFSGLGNFPPPFFMYLFFHLLLLPAFVVVLWLSLQMMWLLEGTVFFSSLLSGVIIPVTTALGMFARVASFNPEHLC